MKIPNQNRNDSNNSGKIHEHSTHSTWSTYKKSEASKINWHGNEIVQVDQPNCVTQIVTPCKHVHKTEMVNEKNTKPSLKHPSMCLESACKISSNLD